jgi:hypothetical protein
MRLQGGFRSKADGKYWFRSKRLDAKRPVSRKAVFDNGHATTLLS